MPLCESPGTETLRLLSFIRASIKTRVNAKLLFFAALLLIAVATPVQAQSQHPIASTQQAKKFEEKITVTARIDYLLSLPADYGQSKKRWPLNR